MVLIRIYDISKLHSRMANCEMFTGLATVFIFVCLNELDRNFNVVLTVSIVEKQIFASLIAL